MLCKAEAVGNARARHSHFGASPELRTLYYQFCVLGSFPVDVVFVLDGNERPKVKRNKKVSSSEHWLVPQAVELAKAFGFHVKQVNHSLIVIVFLNLTTRKAKGEAEAQLALWSKTGKIDIVLTDDIDCLVFGAKEIMKMYVFTLGMPHSGT